MEDFLLLGMGNQLLRISMTRVKCVKSTHVSEQQTRAACLTRLMLKQYYTDSTIFIFRWYTGQDRCATGQKSCPVQNAAQQPCIVPPYRQELCPAGVGDPAERSHSLVQLSVHGLQMILETISLVSK